jgi:hypothetical protein
MSSNNLLKKRSWADRNLPFWDVLKAFGSEIAENLPFIIVVVCLALLVAGQLWGVQSLKDYKEVFLAFLSGGFFTLLAKGRVFRALIREELTNVVYTDEHLKDRKDIKDIWRNTTIAMSLPPHISEMRRKGSCPVSGIRKSRITSKTWSASIA